MEFLRATISGIKYGPQEMEEQKEIVEFCSTPLNFPVQTQKFRFEDNRPTWILKKNPSDPRAGMINEFLTVLSVCHSVLPDFKNKKGQRLSMVMEDSLNDIHDLKIAEIDYQAASPDERALVLAALNFQYFFFKRKSLNVDFHGISIDGQQVMVNILGAVCEFTLYLMVEFDSARKRMSVVVHDPRDNLIKLYCKGADNVIYDRLTEESKERDWNITENHINVCFF
jgi:phospholipid-transporting ATPase